MKRFKEPQQARYLDNIEVQVQLFKEGSNLARKRFLFDNYELVYCLIYVLTKDILQTKKMTKTVLLLAVKEKTISLVRKWN